MNTAEILIRKDGSQSIAAEGYGNGIDSTKIDFIVGEHLKLREDGFHTGQVTSGATLEGISNAIRMGLDPSTISDKLLAMNGVAGHFEKWRISGEKSGLYVVGSLSTEIELEEGTSEGAEIRGGMGEALGNENVLLAANYHDEASKREMTEFEKILAQNGKLFRTESEENDFHSANIAIATGAAILMLCTGTDKFIYKGRKLDEINAEDIAKYLTWLEETQSDNGGEVRKGGMKTKLSAAAHALDNGVESVVIGDSTQDSRKILEDNHGTWVVQ